LQEHYLDCFGGPDSAAGDFSNIQKAINYAMTSFLTTGGIRGGSKNSASFTPRSFNMGISKEVFHQVGGFKNIVGEDIDLSIRIRKAGFNTGLLSDAFVYHKRRIDLKRFYRQVNTFGKGRVLISRMHPGSMKLLHLLPLFFVIGHVVLLLLSLVLLNPWFLLPLPLYMLALFFDSLFRNRHAGIALLSVLAAYIQLFGYGLGLGSEILTKKAFSSTQEELYK
jgi:GT2 family glycosyltransferase